ncbi:MAG: gamma-glutamyltransferase [Planctomycetes bacterium]|nr:gamma-glutamyltransferase [Planctomycetota bacterium]
MLNFTRIQRHLLIRLVAVAGLCFSTGTTFLHAQEPIGFARAVVAADHREASAAGLEMLRQGGNVVDAAVATAFALAVVRPASCGLGGGGFMVIWDARKQQCIAIDYREQAPAAATRDMYIDPDNPRTVRPDASEHGGLAVAVPGHVAGLCLALKRYGTLDLPTVLAPALRLCREGVLIDAHDLAVQKDVLKNYAKHPDYASRFAALRRLYVNEGKPWTSRDLFYSPLGEVLNRIATHGPEGFYTGEVGSALVNEVQRNGGILTLADLSAVKPVVRETLSAKLGNETIYTMPPPSSGGVALLETLQILQALATAHPQAGLDQLSPESPQFLHLLTESFKQAFADRATFLGDADFVQVPVARLTSVDYAARMALKVNLEQTRPSEAYGRSTTPDDGGTSHFSVLDAEGNAVACTETINTEFGSYLVEPRFGIVLNNEMDDFTGLPGVPNAFGLLQSEANSISAGKRPLSSMTPTIVVRDGKAQYVVGASGGPRIITATAQVLLRMQRFGQSCPDAVNAPRLHHQWAPEWLDHEAGLQATVTALERFGHKPRLRNGGAVVQACRRLPDGRVEAASDRRKGGVPAGF